MPGGRPTTFTKELAERIVLELTEGKCLPQICEAPDMPPRTTVIGWQRQIPEFSSQCARAREDGAQILETRIQKVAEKTEAGLIDPHAAKVAISAYQWRASKMNSRAYGEKAHHEHSGEVTLKQLVLQSMKPREED